METFIYQNLKNNLRQYTQATYTNLCTAKTALTDFIIRENIKNDSTISSIYNFSQDILTLVSNEFNKFYNSLSSRFFASNEVINKYSINLLFINRLRDENQKYVYPAKTEEELITKLLTPAIKWAKENRVEDGAKIKVWYDSTLQTNKAVENTKQLLKTLSDEAGLINVILSDIREIEFVNNNKVLFTQNMGLFFRVDFLKLIILAHELETQHNDAAVFSDLDVGDLREDQHGIFTGQRFNKTELFEEQYLQNMKNCGSVLGLGNYGHVDNQFIEMINDKNAITALKYIINHSLTRGITFLNAPDEIQSYMNSIGGFYVGVFYLTVFDFSKLFLSLKNDAIKVNSGFIKTGVPNDEWIKYDPQEHGYEVMGNVIGPHGNWYFDYSIEPYSSHVTRELINFNRDEISKICNLSNQGREIFTSKPSSHFDYCPISESNYIAFDAHYWPIDVDSVM